MTELELTDEDIPSLHATLILSDRGPYVRLVLVHLRSVDVPTSYTCSPPKSHDIMVHIRIYSSVGMLCYFYR